jgi:3',5'-nucleoside bisphosphate phosphatase
LVDLHCHTTESDGSDSPAELIALAADKGLRYLAITDHDTFTAHDILAQHPIPKQLTLIRGMELSTRRGQRSVHVLAYYPQAMPDAAMLRQLESMRGARRDRNVRMARKLQSLGLDVHVEEAEAIGRNITGRVHFARMLQRKQFVRSIQEAFDRYLGDDAPAYEPMDDPDAPLGVRMIRDSGGIAVLAHPVRLGIRNEEKEEAFIRELVDHGLQGIEVIHSDHSVSHVQRYRAIAARYQLLETGGSDYHGIVKPNVQLGSGVEGNVNVPEAMAEALLAAQPLPQNQL